MGKFLNVLARTEPWIPSDIRHVASSTLLYSISFEAISTSRTPNKLDSPHGHVLHGDFTSGVLHGVGDPLPGYRPGHVDRAPGVALQIHTFSLLVLVRVREAFGYSAQRVKLLIDICWSVYVWLWFCRHSAKIGQ